MARVRIDTDQLGAEQQDFLREQADMIKDRVDRYDLYADYVDGKQRTKLTHRQKEYLQASGIPFNENYVRVVVSTLARRLKVTGFQVADDEEVSDWLSTTMWAAMCGQRIQGTVHHQTLALGDGFLINGWDATRDRGIATWNRPQLIKPTYDEDTDQMLHASKAWATSKRGPTNLEGRLISRLNVYYEDRIEKYYALSQADNAIWFPHLDPGETTWPTWSTDSGEEDGEPNGMLVTHFRHNSLGNCFGRSRARDAIPFQDEINKQLLDLFNVMDHQGWAIVTATGIEENAKLNIAPGTILRATDSDATFGKIDPDDPAAAMGAIDGSLKRLSIATSTPMHDLIKGTPPSGEALKTAESGLVAEGQSCTQIDFPEPWAHTARIQHRLASVYGERDVPELDPYAEINVVFDGVETRNERDEAETGLIDMELGASSTTVLRRRGYDPAQETKLRAEEAPVTPPVKVPPPGGDQQQ